MREEYGIDPEPIFLQADVPSGLPESAETRYPMTKIRKLWRLAKEATGDEAIGLKTGKYAKATHFHAFGHSWLASSTLLDGIQRLTRYYQIVCTASAELHLIEDQDSYSLTVAYPDPSDAPPREGIEAGMAALLALCDAVSEQRICPLKIELSFPAPRDEQVYREALRGPVSFNAEQGEIHFSKESLLTPLPHGTPDVARATDRIAEQYIETLDHRKVASRVRRLLIDLLPSGEVDQDIVCARLSRSKSSLQRQLHAEGLSYRDVLDSTRRDLSENYLKDNKYTHAQIAFMVGFTDQSNYARAFKRWTSLSPGEFQAREASPGD